MAEVTELSAWTKGVSPYHRPQFRRKLREEMELVDYLDEEFLIRVGERKKQYCEADKVFRVKKWHDGG
jgi:hypothetical protein